MIFHIKNSIWKSNFGTLQWGGKTRQRILAHAYNQEGWLISQHLLKNWFAEGVASEVYSPCIHTKVRIGDHGLAFIHTFCLMISLAFNLLKCLFLRLQTSRKDSIFSISSFSIKKLFIFLYFTGICFFVLFRHLGK